MAHYCICPICKEKFNRDIIQSVRYGARRYAHQTCYPEGEIVPLPKLSEEEQELKNLEEYIKQLYKIDYIDVKIKKQIKDYKAQYGYSYAGIQKTLYWFYEIKNNPIDKAKGGIGIVPYVYKEAYNYYYHIYMAQMINKEQISYTPQIKIVTIPSPTTHLKEKKYFNI